MKRSFTQYQNEHDSVKEAREKSKQPFNVDPKIPVKILFHCPPIYGFTLKAVPNAQQKNKNEERKAKNEGRRESEKEKNTVELQTKNWAFWACPNFGSYRFASESKGREVYNLLTGLCTF